MSTSCQWLAATDVNAAVESASNCKSLADVFAAPRANGASNAKPVRMHNSSTLSDRCCRGQPHDCYKQTLCLAWQVSHCTPEVALNSRHLHGLDHHAGQSKRHLLWELLTGHACLQASRQVSADGSGPGSSHFL